MHPKMLERDIQHGVELLTQAKNYLTYQERKEREGASLPMRLHISLAQTYVTARIMHPLAFLLGHRAVVDGELESWELEAANWELGGGIECTENPYLHYEGLPKGIKELLAKSSAYYLRISRLSIEHPSSVNYNLPIEITRIGTKYA